MCDHSSLSIDHRLKSFGLGTGPIYLSRLDCQGSEANLLECRTDARATGVHDCSHSDDVGVQCEGTALHDCSHSDDVRVQCEGTVCVNTC